MALISKSSQVMLEELRNSHSWCCIKILSDYCYVWDVVLYAGYPRNDEHEPTIRSGSYEDLNDAVASAYKQGMQWLKDNPIKKGE